MRLTHLARNPLFTTSTPIHLHNDDDHTNDDDNYVVEHRNYDTTIVSPFVLKSSIDSIHRRAFMKQTIDHAISISAATLTIVAAVAVFTAGAGASRAALDSAAAFRQ